MTAPDTANQVALSQLLFGMSWEDPESDRAALAIQPGETLTTISSGGCNTLTLLLDNPAKIHAIDINASQSYLLELGGTGEGSNGPATVLLGLRNTTGTSGGGEPDSAACAA